MDVVGSSLLVAQTLHVSLEESAFGDLLGCESELEGLRGTVQTIRVVLLGAQSKLETESRAQTQVWIEELKDVLYDAEDLLDEFVTVTNQEKIKGSGNKVRVFFSTTTLSSLAFARKMSRGIIEIRKRLNSIISEYNKFGFKLGCQLTPTSRFETGSHVIHGDIIGRQDDVEKIVSRLLSPQSHTSPDVSFLSIVGMGGLGKTALAQLVYNHPVIQAHFPLRLWTCIHDEESWDVKAILCKILESASSKDLEDLTIDHLESASSKDLEDLTIDHLLSVLQETVLGERYLLVLDDLWTEDQQQWLMLRSFLKVGQNTSWVIVTTRSRITASVVGGEIYDLKGLCDEDSWLLFEKIAFRKDQEETNRLEFVQIAQRIVKQCANIPLAIRAVGALLYVRDKQEWLSLVDPGLRSIMPAVKLVINPIMKRSYRHLEPHLKACFRFCALFPRDFVIEKEMLICLWISQGYVVPDLVQSMEEAGEECFSILLWRCFFRDVCKDEYGQIVSFKLHDLMHDLAQDVAGNEIHEASSIVGTYHNSVRHMSYLDWGEGTESLFTSNKIRTYLRVGQGKPESVVAFDPLIAKGTSLRALDLSHSKIRSLPSKLGKLLHLRLLDLSENDELEALHDSITKLHNLKFLRLIGCKRLKELPRDLWRLTNLKVLDTTKCISLTHMPSGVGKLSRLWKLPFFVVGEGTFCKKGVQVSDELKEIKALHNLKGHLYIQIYIPANAKYVMESEEKGRCLSQHLTKIAITFHHEESEDSRTRVYDIDEALLEDLQPHANLRELQLEWYCGGRLPEWARETKLAIFLPNLVRVTLKHCHKLQHLSGLGKLLNLKSLVLEMLYDLEYMDLTTTISSIDSGTGGIKTEELLFPNLEHLELQDLPKLKGWWKDDSSSHREHDRTLPSFPCVSKLKIENCPELASMPLCPSVQDLILKNSNENLQTLKPSEAGSSELRDVETDSMGQLRLVPSMKAFQGPTPLEICEPDAVDSSVSCLATYDQKSEVIDIRLPLHDQDGVQAAFECVESGSVTEIKGKVMHVGEVEIESGSEADGKAGLMQVSHDEQAEPYVLTKPIIQAENSEAGQSSGTITKLELMNTSSDNDRLAQEDATEVVEQMLTSHDLQVGLIASVEPNFSSSFSSSGQGSETLVNPETMAITSLPTHCVEVIDRHSFEAELGQQSQVPGLPEVSTDGPIHRTIEKILGALKIAECKRICLHGRGGSGKTTVLRTLSDRAASMRLFNRIIFVTIPRFELRRKIQSQIAQQLSLNIQDSSSEDEIAAQIWHALTSTSKKTLLLLDDVRETMNLHEVGIPNPGRQNDCWLVSTATSLDVCRDMADWDIEMEVLSSVEAWELFRYQVGDIVDSPGIEAYARAIAEECHGLPLIILAVASALKTEGNVVEWRLALRSLLNSDSPHSAISHIRFCYDRLSPQGAKACFLFCALFANDKEIDISVLVDCFVTEGLLGGRTSLAYNKGYKIVKLLVNASLLEVAANGHQVKMQNIMRETALSILSSNPEGYEVLTGSYLRAGLVQTSSILPSDIDKYLTGACAHLKEPLALGEWKQAEMIFLMDNGLPGLPSELSCPNLEALLLQRSNCLRVIPKSFFDSMVALRILNLSKTRIACLPDSFCNLKSLEVLVLRDCERLYMLPPSIGCLKALEVMDVEGTELTHLPDSICELSRLKQMRVSFYGSINDVECSKLPAKLLPGGAISMMDLRDLGIIVHPGDQRWISIVSNVIEELTNLKLSSLYFHFPDGEHLGPFVERNKSWIQGSLNAFNFIVGHDYKHGVSQVSYDAEMMHNGEKRCLRFVNGESITPAVENVLSRVTSFYLDHHLSISNLLDFGIQAINGLKICILRDCPTIQAIVQDTQSSTEVEVLPFLEYLSINNLWNLESIWVGHLTGGSLAKLRYLSLQACPKLGYAFTCSMLHVLPNLEELVIENCISLNYVVIDDKAAVVISGNPILHNLKVLRLHCLPNLRGIWKGPWPPLEYLSFDCCPKLYNLHMEANVSRSIKEIAADTAWWTSLDWDDLELPRRLNERVTQINLDF